MRKAAIVLIIIGFAVIIGANLYLRSQPEPPPAPMRDDTTLRRTTSGEVVGYRDNGARAWMGIPYAAPPVGDRRWRAPQPPPVADAVLETMAPGPICPQLASILSGGEPGSIAGDEDCLYLNIWAPPNAVGRPVMYWLHGGGNSIGDGGFYNGANLALRHNVVVVTINYRLGFLGWFSHPDLATGNPADDSGNYGTLDAIQGLQWVRDNIAVFGGDPDNVTVFGESAGGTNTLAMIASPLAKGLFHRAIVQSGGYFTETMARAQNYVEEGGHPFSAREIVTKLLVADGTAPDRESAQTYQADMSSSRLRDYLDSKSPAQMFDLFEGGSFSMIDTPRMLRDGHVLPDMSAEQIFSNTAHHNMVPTMIGSNRDEPSLFMVFNPTYTTRWLGFITRLQDERLYRLRVKYGALAWKAWGVDQIADDMTRAGNPHVYAYRFDWDEEPSQLGFDLSVALGAAHALEIPFVFGNFDLFGAGYIYPGDAGQMALSASMMSYWSEFAYNGDPGAGREGKQETWLAWGTDGKRSIILDTPSDQGIFMNDEVVTIAGIKAQLAADTGFTDPQEQCAVYKETFRGEAFDQAEYASLNPSCAAME